MTDESNKTSDPSSKENGSEDEWSIFSKVRSDVLKKKLESVLKKDGVVKSLVSELRLPREIIAHLMSQIDETKHAALGVISREVREFFEKTDLADELARLLSQVSFEITTRVRFVKNDSDKKEDREKSVGKDIAKTESDGSDNCAATVTQSESSHVSDSTDK